MHFFIFEFVLAPKFKFQLQKKRKKESESSNYGINNWAWVFFIILSMTNLALGLQKKYATISTVISSVLG